MNHDNDNNARHIDPQAIFEWMLSRHSVRNFTAQPVERATLEMLLHAATSAPSPTNRQPWRFAVVTRPDLRQQIVGHIARRADEMKAIIQRGHHADEYANYGDFFHEPLASAAVIIVPQYREYPDLMANLLASGGADPAQFSTAASMQAELCATSGAVMNLLLQAHACGLGACWMAGPMIACAEISRLLAIAQPWRMLGAIALGYPAPPMPDAKPRKALDKVVQWFDVF